MLHFGSEGNTIIKSWCLRTWWKSSLSIICFDECYSCKGCRCRTDGYGYTSWKRRKINPNTLVAANEAGVDVIYKVGGAQAIAALAYGTESIAKVDKIVGPGNIYVAWLKKQYLVM